MGAVRLARNGGPLPNARRISTSLFPDVNVLDRVNTMALMEWGQVNTHDAMRVTNQGKTLLPNLYFIRTRCLFVIDQYLRWVFRSFLLRVLKAAGSKRVSLPTFTKVDTQPVKLVKYG